MAGPTTGEGGPSFDFPPATINRISPELYQYLTMLHSVLFVGRDGTKGVLDSTNIVGELTDTDTTNHAQFIGVTAYQHHGTGNHANLDRAGSVGQTSSSNVSVTSANAGGAYGAGEQALLNELKNDLNALVSDLNSVAATVNAIITNMRNAGLMS